jgi:hypothetical protein
VLANWALREGLGRYHPDPIARAIEDLKDPPEEKPKPRRYEITLPGVMWSEDGTGLNQAASQQRSEPYSHLVSNSCLIESFHSSPIP